MIQWAGKAPYHIIVSDGTVERDNATITDQFYLTDPTWPAGDYVITITDANGQKVQSNPLTIENLIPILINDSYTTGWIPEFVKPLTYKLDSVPVSGSLRYMAVWLVKDSDKATTGRLPSGQSRPGQGKVASYTVDDPTVVKLPDTPTLGGRGFQFSTLKAGQADITITLDDGTECHLLVGVSQDVVIAPAPAPRARRAKAK